MRTARFVNNLLGLMFAAVALTGCLATTLGQVAPYPTFARETVPVVLPANAQPITQQFYRFARDGGPGHLGIDIGGPVGTPVLAAAAGTVYLSYSEPMYGNRIIIDHGIGRDGRRSFTQYKHLHSRNVSAGTRVRQGQQIGTLGQTGVLSSYPHLHFEVTREAAPGRRTARGSNWWQGMVPEDPNKFWARGPGRPSCARQLRGGQGPLPLIYPVACSQG